MSREKEKVAMQVNRFGDIIKQNRTAFKLTLEALAKKVGTHKGYLSGVENHKVNPPSAKVIRKLCSILKLKYEDMLLQAWAEKAPKDVRERALKLILLEEENGIKKAEAAAPAPAPTPAPAAAISA